MQEHAHVYSYTRTLYAHAHYFDIDVVPYHRGEQVWEEMQRIAVRVVRRALSIPLTPPTKDRASSIWGAAAAAAAVTHAEVRPAECLRQQTQTQTQTQTSSAHSHDDDDAAVAAALPPVAAAAWTCPILCAYQSYAFDFMIDAHTKPWLIGRV